MNMTSTIIAVHRHEQHQFSKNTVTSVDLVEGLGVAGDAHNGVTVKHRSRVAKDPSQPNLRQVHLIHAELLDELSAQGMHVQPGQMGENITTRGIDVLGLSTGTRLSLGSSAIIEITGLRNPCGQIDNFMPGLLAAVLDRDANGALVRRAGVMAIVIRGGSVAPADAITINQVAARFAPLLPV
jgi:MOSC domain-containing protein YiiM